LKKFKICGITFSCNKDSAFKANVVDKIDKMESNLITWLHSGLLIPGKIVNALVCIKGFPHEAPLLMDVHNGTKVSPFPQAG